MNFLCGCVVFLFLRGGGHKMTENGIGYLAFFVGSVSR